MNTTHMTVINNNNMDWRSSKLWKDKVTMDKNKKAAFEAWKDVNSEVPANLTIWI